MNQRESRSQSYEPRAARQETVKWTCLVTLAFLSLTISGHKVHQGAHLTRQSAPNNKPYHPKAEATSTAKPQIQRARNPLDGRVTPLESQISEVRSVYAMISRFFTCKSATIFAAFPPPRTSNPAPGRTVSQLGSCSWSAAQSPCLDDWSSPYNSDMTNQVTVSPFATSMDTTHQHVYSTTYFYHNFSGTAVSR